jgi:hypothetical protein
MTLEETNLRNEYKVTVITIIHEIERTNMLGKKSITKKVLGVVMETPKLRVEIFSCYLDLPKTSNEFSKCNPHQGYGCWQVDLTIFGTLVSKTAFLGSITGHEFCSTHI